MCIGRRCVWINVEACVECWRKYVRVCIYLYGSLYIILCVFCVSQQHYGSKAYKVISIYCVSGSIGVVSLGSVWTSLYCGNYYMQLLVSFDCIKLTCLRSKACHVLAGDCSNLNRTLNYISTIVFNAIQAICLELGWILFATNLKACIFLYLLLFSVFVCICCFCFYHNLLIIQYTSGGIFDLDIFTVA